jgi:hypothetical protein
LPEKLAESTRLFATPAASELQLSGPSQNTLTFIMVYLIEINLGQSLKVLA